jgi:hypothetical protein
LENFWNLSLTLPLPLFYIFLLLFSFEMNVLPTYYIVFQERNEEGKKGTYLHTDRETKKRKRDWDGG